jgi:hypothetical protein
MSSKADRPVVAIETHQVPHGSKFFWVITKSQNGKVLESEFGKDFYDSIEEAEAAGVAHRNATVA